MNDTAPKSRLAADDLTGLPRRINIKAPVADPTHIESLTAFDQFCRARRYPKALMALENDVRALLNYGHKVWIVPERSALEERLEQLTTLPDLPEDSSASAHPEMFERLKLYQAALIDVIKYIRGE